MTHTGPHFTNLEAWKEAIILLTEVKELTDTFRGPDAPKAAKQLLEAAESISANIAEGYGKGFSFDNLRYLKIATASADEVDSRLHSSLALGRFSSSRCAIPMKRVQRVRSLIAGYSRHVERNIPKAS